MRIFLVTLAVLVTVCVFGCDEDPRIEEHNKLTSYLIALGDKQAQAIEDAKRVEKQTISEDEDE